MGEYGFLVLLSRFEAAKYLEKPEKIIWLKPKNLQFAMVDLLTTEFSKSTRYFFDLGS